jgi:hypothetical protein
MRFPRGWWLLVLLLPIGVPTLAVDASGPWCRLVLYQEQVRREDVALDLDLARSREVAAAEVFVLLEGLLEVEAVQELVYLAGKHERDATRLETERHELALRRQEDAVDQLRVICDSLNDGEMTDEERRAVDEEFLGYRRVDCSERERRAAIAHVHLEYRQAVLESFRDLRESDVATKQDIIISERNVDLARKRLEDLKGRATSCQERLRAGSAEE